MTPRELETIPVARGLLVYAHRDQAVERLGASQRRLDALAAEAREGPIGVDLVDAAIDAHKDAHAIAGEWVPQWRTP